MRVEDEMGGISFRGDNQYLKIFLLSGLEHPPQVRVGKTGKKSH